MPSIPPPRVLRSLRRFAARLDPVTELEPLAADVNPAAAAAPIPAGRGASR